MYFRECGFGNQTQVDTINDLLKQNVDKRFDSIRKAQGIKLWFIVAAIHRRNIDGEMSLLVDILPNLVLLR